MDSPDYADLADTLTANFRTMRYVEANMNDMLATIHLLQLVVFGIVIGICLLLARKVFHGGTR